ncbi:MAG: transposase family protein [Patescibacteria group bacterium]
MLQDRFLPETKLRKKRGRINTLDELIAEYPEIDEVIADGIGITTRMPKRRQKKNYSGKSKKHEKKSVLIVNGKSGLILERTEFRPRAVHDKRILEEDRLYGKLRDPNLKKRADSAWTGEDSSKNWIVNKRAVRGHPLTDKDKKENKALSRIRIKVEHAIRRIKIFKRIGDKTSFRAKNKLSEVFNVAINLANYKQLSRFSAKA